MTIGDVVGSANLVGGPLGRSPVEGLALTDHVAHGPHGLFDRRRGIPAVTEDEVHEVEPEALERSVDGLAKVLAIKRVAHVGHVVQAPEQFGRDDVLVALPAQFTDGGTHDPLGFTGGISLGVVKEIDAGVLGGTQAFGGLLGGLELVGVAKGHPAAKGEHAHFESRPS